jgi:putative copper resistance protein D
LITAPDAVVIGLRALSVIALFQGAGCALFLWLFRSQLQTTQQGLRRLASVAVYGAIVFTVAHHFLGPARLTGSFGAIFDLSLQQFLLESSVGPARILRIVGLLLIAQGLRQPVPTDFRLVLLGVAAALGSFSLMGHTTTHDPRLLLMPLLLIHLGIIAFWFGSLLPLIHVTEAESVTVSNAVLNRFSKLAIWSVPLILLAGLLMWYLFLPGALGLATFTLPYSRIILAKVAAFALLLVLAALNKWRYLPGVLRGDAVSQIALRRSIAREWSLMAFVFILTAFLTGLFSPD